MSIRAPHTFARELSSPTEHLAALRHVSAHYDADLNTIWCRIRGDAPTRFTNTLLEDFLAIKSLLEDGNLSAPHSVPAFQVIRSDIPGIYGLGGDLPLVARLIRERKRAELFAYASKCAELVRALSSGYGHGIYSISLVQGAAFGGAFEAALSSQLIIAERSAVFGFPELLFNLFPGMGALLGLRRRISHAQAMKLIETARTYTAAELLDAGIVDIIVSDGDGLPMVDSFIRGKLRRLTGFRALQKAGALVEAPSQAEILRITDLWVDAAMTLSEPDVRTMLRIAAAQERKRVRAMLSHVA